MQPVLGLCSLELDHMTGKHCCVPGQAPQHKATSGGASRSVCRIYVGFLSSTLALESNMPDTSCQKNRKPAAGAWDTEDEKPHVYMDCELPTP